MRTAIRALGLTLSVLGSSVAFEALAAQTAYFDVGTAYLVDTNAKTKTAQVASNLGARAGRYTDSGVQRTISLMTPISYEVVGDWTACQVQQVWRRDVQTLVLKRQSGTAKKGKTAVIESGIDTEISGCEVGKVTPFGNPDDAGITLNHLALTERPSMTDVMLGTRWAGLHEDAFTPSPFFSGLLAADVVTWQSDGLTRFERTGTLVSSAKTGDGWWALTLPHTERRYTRLSKDKATGAEEWLFGDVGSDGIFAWVASTWVVPYKPGKGFGDVGSAARAWESPYDPGTYYRNMYSDFTEDIYQKLDDLSWDRWVGWNWRFDQRDVIHTNDSTSMLRTRKWEPVRRVGTAQWLMDEYTFFFKSTGETRTVIQRRLFYYIDSGPAVKPVTGIRRSDQTRGRSLAGTDAERASTGAFR